MFGKPPSFHTGCLCLSWWLILSAGEVRADSNARGNRPNFVFIVVDDLGWTGLRCYGSDLHETPHIDRLACQGVKFTDAYAAAPVCTPTRAAIMTGKYPARLHMTLWRQGARRPPSNHKLIPPVTVGNLPLKQVTVAEVLKSAGYATAHIGKWHLGDAAHYPETQGFDVNIGGNQFGATDTFFFPYRGNKYWGQFYHVPHLERGKKGEYLTDRLTDEALKAVDAMKDRPFFLHLAYYTVHTPIEAKQALVDRYAKRITPGMRHTNATYAAMVHSLDENVGRLLTRLDQLGLTDNTMVILTSDNGALLTWLRKHRVTSNFPLRSGKMSLYEGGVRVPLIVRWPGVAAAGTVCNEPVGSIDFYPTILAAAGLEGDPVHNADLDGLSLVPLLKNPRAKLNRQALFWHSPHYFPVMAPVTSMRARDWKLLEFHEYMRVELYNLREDIAEEHDLAADMPDRVAQLRSQLHDWRRAVSAQMPTPNPKP